MKLSHWLSRIEKERVKLHELALEHGLLDERVIQQSQLLDHYLNQQYKLAN